jgi:hypothetical protein
MSLRSAQKIDNSQDAQVIWCPPFCSLILFWGDGVGRTPFILNLSTSWRWVVSFTPWPLYPKERTPVPLSRRLDGPRSLSGCFWRREKSPAHIDLIPSQDSVVAEWPRKWEAIPSKARCVFLFQSIWTGSGLHSATCSMGSGGSFVGVTLARA